MDALDGVYSGCCFLYGAFSGSISPESTFGQIQRSPDMDGNMVYNGHVVCLGAFIFARAAGSSREFVTGYIVELSLSMDNVFVIALIFGYFRVPLPYQHRVLFWEILGALIMRGIMIGAGDALVRQFEWALMVFGAFLVFTGVKMFFSKEEGGRSGKNMAIRLVRKFLRSGFSFGQLG